MLYPSLFFTMGDLNFCKKILQNFLKIIKYQKRFKKKFDGIENNHNYFPITYREYLSIIPVIWTV